MEERDRELLRDHQRYIANNLRVCDIKSYLIEKKVFNTDMFEEIQTEPTRRQEVEKFLDLLVLRGPDAFGHFCDALKTDYNFLFEKLTTECKKTPDHSLKEENKRLKNDNLSKGRKVAELSKVLSFLYQTLENIEKELQAEGVACSEVIKLVKKGMKKLQKHLPTSRPQNKHPPKDKKVSTPNVQPDKSKDTSTTNVNDSDIQRRKTEPQQLSSTSTRSSLSETTESKPRQYDTGQDTKDRDNADDLSTISSSTASNPTSGAILKTDLCAGTSKVPTNQSLEGVKDDKLPSKPSKLESQGHAAPIFWKTGQQVSETESYFTTSQTKENRETKDKQGRTGFTYSLVPSESKGMSNKTVHPYTGRRHSLQRTRIQPFGQIRVSGSKTSGSVFRNTSSFPVHAHQMGQVQDWKTREDTRKDSPPRLVKGRYLPKSQSLPKL